MIPVGEVPRVRHICVAMSIVQKISFIKSLKKTWIRMKKFIVSWCGCCPSSDTSFGGWVVNFTAEGYIFRISINRSRKVCNLYYIIFWYVFRKEFVLNKCCIRFRRPAWTKHQSTEWFFQSVSCNFFCLLANCHQTMKQVAIATHFGNWKILI